MAKKKQGMNNGQANEDSGKETISGYFRRVFTESPKLLDSRSNDELIKRWLADHPGTSENPERVRQILANVKSVLRKQGRQHLAASTPKGKSAAAPAGPRQAPVNKLEYLEERIDDCLTIAKVMDAEALASVIQLLRRARNEVVWKMGQ